MRRGTGRETVKMKEYNQYASGQTRPHKAYFYIIFYAVVSHMLSHEDRGCKPLIKCIHLPLEN